MRWMWAAILFATACIFLVSLSATEPQQTEPDALGVRIKREIEARQRGQPNYDQMEPAMQEAVRKQIVHVQKILLQLGTVESVNFVREQKGLRIYVVWFSNGKVYCGIAESPGGKLRSFWFNG